MHSDNNEKKQVANKYILNTVANCLIFAGFAVIGTILLLLILTPLIPGGSR